MIKDYVLIAFLLITMSTSGLITNQISKEDSGDKLIQSNMKNELVSIPFTDEWGNNSKYIIFDDCTFVYDYNDSSYEIMLLRAILHWSTRSQSSPNT